MFSLFWPQKYILKPKLTIFLLYINQIFSADPPMQCTETETLYFFCPWKYEKNAYKSTGDALAKLSGLPRQPNRSNNRKNARFIWVFVIVLEIHNFDSNQQATFSFYNQLFFPSLSLTSLSCPTGMVAKQFEHFLRNQINFAKKKLM